MYDVDFSKVQQILYLFADCNGSELDLIWIHLSGYIFWNGAVRCWEHRLHKVEMKPLLEFQFKEFWIRNIGTQLNTFSLNFLSIVGCLGLMWVAVFDGDNDDDDDDNDDHDDGLQEKGEKMDQVPR